VARPGDKTLLPRLREHLHLLPTGEQGIADLSAFLADILELGPDRWIAGGALPPRFSLDVPDAGQTLRPTQALVRGPAAEPVALLWDVPPGLPLDQPETTTGEWDYPPPAKHARLLRPVNVPVGFLTNRCHIRLMYAPHGASTGGLTFRMPQLATPAGKPLLDAFVMLLHARQWFSVAPERQLPSLLAKSREAQAQVTRELADQVLEALHILLAGFEAADGGEALHAAYRDPERGGDHVYAGLLSVMLRLVFVLYAEDNGLLPCDDDFYAENLSVLGLYDDLAADAGSYPDAMSRRYGAYGRLIALFRAVFFGVAHGGLRMAARLGGRFTPRDC